MATLNPIASNSTFSPFGMGNSLSPVASTSPSFGQNQQLQFLQQEQQMQEMMMLMMTELMQLLGGGQSSGSGSSPALAANYGDSSGGGSGSSGATSGNYNSAAEASGTGKGVEALKIGDSQMGKQAQNVSFGNYNHNGGRDNRCADFVSACLANAGEYKKTAGDGLVTNFEQDLKKQGFKQVSKADAQPGDVIIYGNQHTELVAAKGATKTLGSNNIGGGDQQTVSNETTSWYHGDIRYYHKG